MCLSVHTHEASIRIYHCNAVIKNCSRLLIKTHRDHGMKLFCSLAEMNDCRILIHCFGIFIKIISAFLAEIGTFKKLRKEYDICSFLRSLSHQFVSFADIFIYIVCHLHLADGKIQISHGHYYKASVGILQKQAV